MFLHDCDCPSCRNTVVMSFNIYTFISVKYIDNSSNLFLGEIVGVLHYPVAGFYSMSLRIYTWLGLLGFVVLHNHDLVDTVQSLCVKLMTWFFFDNVRLYYLQCIRSEILQSWILVWNQFGSLRIIQSFTFYIFIISHYICNAYWFGEMSLVWRLKTEWWGPI